MAIDLDARKTCRHHTDDGERHRIELNCPADHRWIRPEAPLPERVGEDDVLAALGKTRDNGKQQQGKRESARSS